MAINGYCDPLFAGVEEEFRRNFETRNELGAAVSIWHKGKCAVNLWGGYTDEARSQPWAHDTMAVVFSSTKGLAAMCVHILIDRGLVDVDAPLARYWPEFAANGKGAISVGMCLSHQAGLPVWQAPIAPGGLNNWDVAAAQLAAEAPIWEPGTAHGYHGITIGWLVGELVRRVTGKTIGTFLRDEIARPLGADIWIGLPQAEHWRVAPIVFPEMDQTSPYFQKIIQSPQWYGAKLLGNIGDDMSPGSVNSSERLLAEHPSAGGVASAEGLARAYAPLSQGGVLGDYRMVSADALPDMRIPRAASSRDLILQIPTAYTLGFSKSWGTRSGGSGEHAMLGEQAFGTVGFGGSVGLADEQAQLAFGYVMNRLGVGTGLNNRGQSLVDAAYKSVGFSHSRPGHWVA